MYRKTGGDDGSITLEYCMTLGVASPVLVLWLEIFNPETGYTDFGWSMMQFFQRILTGISLPIP